MKSFSLKLCLLVGAFVSSAAFAAGPSGDRVATYIEILGDGTVLVEANPGFDNPDSCSDSSRVVVEASNSQIKTYTATALTAYAAGDKVWAWVEGCWTAPWNASTTYPIVRNMATRK